METEGKDLPLGYQKKDPEAEHTKAGLSYTSEAEPRVTFLLVQFSSPPSGCLTA